MFLVVVVLLLGRVCDSAVPFKCRVMYSAKDKGSIASHFMSVLVDGLVLSGNKICFMIDLSFVRTVNDIMIAMVVMIIYFFLFVFFYELYVMILLILIAMVISCDDWFNPKDFMERHVIQENS